MDLISPNLVNAFADLRNSKASQSVQIQTMSRMHIIEKFLQNKNKEKKLTGDKKICKQGEKNTN
jgi:hypothetical protein